MIFSSFSHSRHAEQVDIAYTFTIIVKIAQHADLHACRFKTRFNAKTESSQPRGTVKLEKWLWQLILKITFFFCGKQCVHHAILFYMWLGVYLLLLTVKTNLKLKMKS